MRELLAHRDKETFSFVSRTPSQFERGLGGMLFNLRSPEECRNGAPVIVVIVGILF